MSKLPIEETHSDFWLDKDQIDQYIPDEEKESSKANFSIDLIQLAAYRKVISNFVSILTGQNIPVQFFTNNDRNSTDGKTVWLSSSIRKKSDFDWSVGLALHEGSHVIKSDFNVLKTMFARIPLPLPQPLKDKAKAKHITNEQLAYLCKWVLNVVEDRYVDSYIYNEAPGYRGYYRAMYKKLWNSEEVSKVLESDMYRLPNLSAYEYRVINLTNPSTNLLALPGLVKIAELLNLQDIFRLTTTKERLEVSLQIVEVIIDNLGKQVEDEEENSSKATIKKFHDVLSEYFDLPNDKNKTKGQGKGKTDEEDDEENNDGSDGIGVDGETVDDSNSECVEPKEEIDNNIEPDDVGDTKDFTDKQVEKIKSDFDKQKQSLKHDYSDIKESVSVGEKSLLEVIEKYGIILMPTGFGMGSSLPGDYTQAAVDCIVVQKLTRELIESGQKIFPMAAIEKVPGQPFEAPKEYTEAVNRGFIIGKSLGKKLQVRGEINIIKFIRKISGKIERRLLHGIGAGLEDVFNKTIIERYNRCRLHISIDASSSMSCPTKWIPTLTCVTSICVAASMVDNLSISVSFRCTHYLSDGVELPYIVLAYDSTKDKIQKVRSIFPFLRAYGCTPEGLAFEAVMDEFIIGKKSDGQDNYFLNISDGEPFYELRETTNKYRSSFSYQGEPAALHTKRQVDKIRASDVKVLSYFIKSDELLNGLNYGILAPTIQVVPMTQDYGSTLKSQFQRMYGKDSQFIDVTNVMDIAKTMNKLFLSKD
jgi:hypothetical protein